MKSARSFSEKLAYAISENGDDDWNIHSEDSIVLLAHKRRIESFLQHGHFLALTLEQSLVDGDQFVERVEGIELYIARRLVALLYRVQNGGVVETVDCFRCYAEGCGDAVESRRVDPFGLLKF